MNGDNHRVRLSRGKPGDRRMIRAIQPVQPLGGFRQLVERFNDLPTNSCQAMPAAVCDWFARGR